MGSKNRIAKEILPIMESYRKLNQIWVEPFVGGANLIDKCNGKCIASDSNRYLISLYKQVMLGWMPPKNITETEYNDIKKNKENYPEELVAYVGFALSYGGKWFGGWCRDSKNVRNYVEESYNNAYKQFSELKQKNIVFNYGSYDEIEIPNNSLIYCDPPYNGTTAYKNKFDSEYFYKWCVDMANIGHTVFVSEYQVLHPKFTKIWEKKVSSSLTKDTGSKVGIECLYIVGNKIECGYL